LTDIKNRSVEGSNPSKPFECHDAAAVKDAVARYREASEAGDVTEIMRLLSPDVELVSPLSGRMVFRGQADLQVLTTAVYNTLSSVQWQDEAGDGRVRLLRGEARVGPFKLGDAMVLELAEDGRIRRIRPHFRPWLGLTAFALSMGPKIARHPGALMRALRRP
jgi:hypothetical protein